MSVSLFATRDTEKCPFSVLTGLIYEKIFELSVGKRNRPLYTVVCIKRVSVERGFPVLHKG